GPGQYVNPDPAVLTGAEVDALFDQLVTSLSDPNLLLGLNAGLTHPFGFAGFTATLSGGAPTLPTLPFDPDPTVPSPMLPLQTITHVNPSTGTADMCFGPVNRTDAGPVAIADEENGE
ncbi:MAG: hypothetical protein ACU85V_12630, partial [Gammaproteobacteria bacterium]